MVESRIEGVTIRSLARFTDSRGWLMELFREDDLPRGLQPVMGYISVTHPEVVRGPHEHREQSDGFCFLSGQFRLTLWENRPGRAALREDHLVGADNPVVVVVPPGVVHAYANVGAEDSFVLNFPDRLYAGHGRREAVDEIRHEEIDSEFKP